MENYVLYADSACDVKREILDEWGVKYECLTFKFSDSEKQYLDGDMSPEEFYSRIKAGDTVKTAAVNMAAFKEGFGRELKAGNDVLYLGFSSGLSNTYNAARLAAEELLEEYPDRRVIVVDTLAASAGYALLLWLTVRKKNEGATIEEAARFALSERLKICHWFTVSDLAYLRRGGRISHTAAAIGGMLNIRPVLHMDNDGKLINMYKVRGERATYAKLCEIYEELAEKKDGTVFLCHAAMLESAETIGKMLSEKYGAKVELITDVGAVIGAHTGPGTFSIFFVGKER